jgi:chromosome segregation ATPase
VLLERSGFTHVRFEPACFPAYDMFLIASRRSLTPQTPSAVTEVLTAAPDGRAVQALLDVDDRWRDLQAHTAEVERDRAARLATLQEQGARLKIVEGERNALREELGTVKDALAVSEADRAARLALIHEQGARLVEHSARLVEHSARLADAESQNAANLCVARQQADRILEIEAERDALRAELAALTFPRLRAVGSRIREWLRAIGVIGRA